MPARQELHQLIEQFNEPQAKRILRLVKSEFSESAEHDNVHTQERPWPASIGAGHSGLGDVSTNPEKYFTQGFGL